MTFDYSTEQAILGGMLLDPDAVETSMRTVVADDFASHGHREIFAAICDLYRAGTRVDAVTVAAALDGRESLAEVGGCAYLVHLTQQIPEHS